MSQKNNNRCFECRKKIPVALQGISCHCDHYFCAVHRLPELHHCAFNRRDAHLESAESQAKKMKCIASKINKI